MQNVSQIEAPFFKVPYETLKKAAKERKSVVDETTRLVSSLTSMTESADLTSEKAAEQLDNLVTKLGTLKRKLDEVSLLEKESAERFQARMKCLADLGEPEKDHVVDWNGSRIDRLLIDYFLRYGFRESAEKLIESSTSEELVDAHVFRNAYRVIDGLKNHTCEEALAWCIENRGRLKKIKSKLEFKLHVQVFIELVRKKEMSEAIKYAQRNLAPWANQYMSELQTVVATIAFKADTKCERYKVLFQEESWDLVLEQFYEALFKLNALTSQSLLDIHLQAGLSALKTHHSYEPDCCAEDPLHLTNFQKLAENLPYAKYNRSKLVCCVTKEVMNADNPPKVLPNGYVYSSRAIEQLTDSQGKVTCPCTGKLHEQDCVCKAGFVFLGDVCDANEVRHAYIV